MSKDQEFADEFEMKSGKYRFDGWRIDDPEGDCNDFALTMAYILAGGSLIKMFIDFLFLKTVIWWVWSPYNDLIPRHIALWHRGKGWIDSNNPSWSKSHRQIMFALPLTFLPFLPWVILRAFHGLIYKIFD